MSTDQSIWKLKIKDKAVKKDSKLYPELNRNEKRTFH